MTALEPVSAGASHANSMVVVSRAWANRLVGAPGTVSRTTTDSSVLMESPATMALGYDITMAAPLPNPGAGTAAAVVGSSTATANTHGNRNPPTAAASMRTFGRPGIDTSISEPQAASQCQSVSRQPVGTFVARALNAQGQHPACLVSHSGRDGPGAALGDMEAAVGDTLE